jgi:hypothetical protein
MLYAMHIFAMVGAYVKGRPPVFLALDRIPVVMYGVSQSPPLNPKLPQNLSTVFYGDHIYFRPQEVNLLFPQQQKYVIQITTYSIYIKTFRIFKK